MSLTYRESKYVSNRLLGKSMAQSLLAAGFSKHLADHPNFVVTPEMEEEVERLQSELVANTLQAGLIDATEIHEYLTDAIRARMSDIRNDDHSFKPRSEWPEIWDRMEEAGDVEVTYETERSHDGETIDTPGGWDKTGRVVLKVKLKFASKTKLIELAMKHKGVNAMVQPDSGDLHLHVTVTAERAREVAAAKRRMERVIDIVPEGRQIADVSNDE